MNHVSGMTHDIHAVASAAVGAWDSPHVTRAFLAERMDDLRAALGGVAPAEPVARIVAITPSGRVADWHIHTGGPVDVGDDLYASAPVTVGIDPAAPTPDRTVTVYGLRAPAPRTDEQLDQHWRAAYAQNAYRPGSFDWFAAGWRAAEAFFGIRGAS